MTEKLTVYRPDARVRSGLFKPLAELVREIASKWWHIWISFRREFAAAHSATGLGVVWNVILPLAPIGAYVVLSYARLFPSRDGIPAAVYISLGVTLWFVFTGAITSPMAAVQSRHRMVAQTSYPLIGIVLSSFGNVAFETLVRAIATAIVIGFMFGVPPLRGLLALPILIAALVFFGAAGLLFSILNIVAQDISRIVRVVLTYLVFVSNVIFPIDRLRALGWVAPFNPFSVFVDNIRHTVLFGAPEDLQAVLAWSAAGVVLLVIAARVFYVMEWRIRGFS